MNQTDPVPAFRSRGWRLLPVLLWMAVIFGFSSRTGDEMGTLLPWFKKIIPAMQGFDWGHFVAYFILALLADYAVGRRADSWIVKLAIVAFCMLYGVTDEYHQSFVAGRMSDIHDIRNDGIGAAIAVLLLSLPGVKRRWRRLAG